MDHRKNKLRAISVIRALGKDDPQAAADVLAGLSRDELIAAAVHTGQISVSLIRSRGDSVTGICDQAEAQL